MQTKAKPTRAQLRRAFSICVRTLRERSGISQERLAEQAGIDRAYMGAIERGEHTPTLGMIYRLLPPLKLTFVDFARAFETALRAARASNDAAA